MTAIDAPEEQPGSVAATGKAEGDRSGTVRRAETLMSVEGGLPGRKTSWPMSIVVDPSVVVDARSPI
jgi:hypothetical protein